MPTFATPQPITATVEIVSGSVNLTASDRDDTVVTVSPRDPNRASDVRVAESARVDFTNGTLTVTAGRRIISLGRGGAVTVDIELPSRSRLQVSSASAKLRADGDFGECRLSTASGDAAIGSVTGNFKSDSASGAISVDVLTGEGTVSTASGDATFGELAATSSSGRPAGHCRSSDFTASSTRRPHPATPPLPRRYRARCPCRAAAVTPTSASRKARRRSWTCGHIPAKCATTCNRPAVPLTVTKPCT